MVDALRERPELDFVEEFYSDFYLSVGTDVIAVKQYAELYGMTPGEIIETLFIMRIVDDQLRT